MPGLPNSVCKVFPKKIEEFLGEPQSSPIAAQSYR